MRILNKTPLVKSETKTSYVASFSLFQMLITVQLMVRLVNIHLETATNHAMLKFIWPSLSNQTIQAYNIRLPAYHPVVIFSEYELNINSAFMVNNYYYHLHRPRLIIYSNINNINLCYLQSQSRCTKLGGNKFNNKVLIKS